VINSAASRFNENILAQVVEKEKGENGKRPWGRRRKALNPAGPFGSETRLLERLVILSQVLAKPRGKE
jgi:hypothetical protein